MWMQWYVKNAKHDIFLHCLDFQTFQMSKWDDSGVKNELSHPDFPTPTILVE